MANTTTACVERTPSHNDLEITRLAHRALADIRDAGRFGDRKVFVSAVWTQMLAIEAQTGGTLTDGASIQHFQAWLLRARLLTADGTENGARLVVLCRADLVAAMDPGRVAASEIAADGAAFHFILDPAVARDDYAPRKATVLTTATGRVGKVGASRRAA